MVLPLLLGSVLLAGAPSPAVDGQPDVLLALERQQQRLFDTTARSVVHIRTRDALGSGFFVTGDGLILTNHHVVGDAREVQVTFYNGKTTKGHVIERAAGDVDLALVRVRVRGARPIELGDPRALDVGAWVGAVGHSEGMSWTFNTGMISNIYPMGEIPMLQTQIPLNAGNSGGPVIDRRGRVVGVVTSKLVTAENLNFAIRIDAAPQVLSRLRPHCNCLVSHAPKGVPIFVDGQLAGHGPTAVVMVDPGPHEVLSVIEGQRYARSVEFPAVRDVDLRPKKPKRGE